MQWFSANLAYKQQTHRQWQNFKKWAGVIQCCASLTASLDYKGPLRASASPVQNPEWPLLCHWWRSSQNPGVLALYLAYHGDCSLLAPYPSCWSPTCSQRSLHWVWPTCHHLSPKVIRVTEHDMQFYRGSTSGLTGYKTHDEWGLETTWEETEPVTLELSNRGSLLDLPFLGSNRVIIKQMNFRTSAFSFHWKCAFLSLQGEVPGLDLIKLSSSFQLL